MMPDVKVHRYRDALTGAGRLEVIVGFNEQALEDVFKHKVLPSIFYHVQQAVAETLTKEFLAEHRQAVLTQMDPEKLATMAMASAAAKLLEKLA